MSKFTIEYTASNEITNKLVKAVMDVMEKEQAEVNSISNIPDKEIKMLDFMKGGVNQ